MEMLNYDNNIYLHFFDRELRNSVGEKLFFTDDNAQRVIFTALLMTNLPLYVSFSHMYESLENFPISINLAFECEKYGLLKMLTNMRNIDEFLSSRRLLYDFDKNRYLNYFNRVGSFWPKDTVIVKNDTTSILRSKVFESIENENAFSEQVKESLQLLLIKDKQNAITFSLFRNKIQNIYSQSFLTDSQYQRNITDIKEIISRQYTFRYLGVYDGTIITGIPGFAYYDDLAKDRFLTNYVLFSEILSPLYFIYNHFWEILELRLNSKYQTLHNILQWVVVGLQQLSENKLDIAISIIRKYRATSAIVHSYNDFESHCLGLYDFINKQSNGLEGIHKMQGRIMLVVATPLELAITLEKLKNMSSISQSIGDLSYVIASINQSLVYVVKCQMGQNGVGGVILTLEEAIRVLAPDFVILGGIAWGANKKKQNIGDLLISTQVWDYDIVRVNSDGSIISRGPISPSSARLVAMFEIVCASIKNCKIHYGLIASGSDLLDNEEYVNRFKTIHPELIGGDMESAGMASVCSRKRVDWLLVKGVCDWGYGKNLHKEEYQRIAAINSIDAILSVLTQLDLSKKQQLHTILES
jgi:nucleoside phosphorylase